MSEQELKEQLTEMGLQPGYLDGPSTTARVVKEIETLRNWQSGPTSRSSER